jgi:hypothetical protein
MKWIGRFHVLNFVIFYINLWIAGGIPANSKNGFGGTILLLNIIVFFALMAYIFYLEEPDEI